jgi:hypothetical protein
MTVHLRGVWAESPMASGFVLGLLGQVGETAVMLGRHGCVSAYCS